MKCPHCDVAINWSPDRSPVMFYLPEPADGESAINPIQTALLKGTASAVPPPSPHTKGL